MVVKLRGIKVKVKERLPLVAEAVETHKDLLALWLFGSYAKGRATPLSDIDIAYLPALKLAQPQIDKLDRELYLQLSKLFETDEITLINLRDAPVVLAFSVLQEGKLIFCRNSEDKDIEGLKERILSLYPEIKRLKSKLLQEFAMRIGLEIEGVNMLRDKEKMLEQLSLLREDLKKLKEKSRLSKEEYLADEDSKAVVERKFQTATETCVNIGNHLICSLDLRLAEDYASVFHSLKEAKVISRELTEQMANMARFRNLLVRLYWKIDHEKIYKDMKKRIKILERFMKEITSFLKAKKEGARA